MFYSNNLEVYFYLCPALGKTPLNCNRFPLLVNYKVCFEEGSLIAPVSKLSNVKNKLLTYYLKRNTVNCQKQVIKGGVETNKGWSEQLAFPMGKRLLWNIQYGAYPESRRMLHETLPLELDEYSSNKVCNHSLEY